MLLFKNIKIPATFILLFLSAACFAQQTSVENLILVTTDGLRWQEVFKGLDKAITHSKKDNEGAEAELNTAFGGTAQESRRKIFPFIWTEMATSGQLFGNRESGSKVNTKNPHWFSYPGYAELFNGYVYRKIRSNSFPENPKTTFLEFLNKQPALQGRVAAFGSWETFDKILNPQKSQIILSTAFTPVKGLQSNKIDSLIQHSARPFGNGVSTDELTHLKAITYLKAKKPRVLFVGYGETDEWGHARKYKSYVYSAHQFDKYLSELWEFVQTDPQYKDKTALVVTVDHGRGERMYWTSHGNSVSGANEIWFGVIAPGLTPKGEISGGKKLHLQQLAQTLCKMLGYTFESENKLSDVIPLN